MFIDASAIVGLSVSWDEHHREASTAFASLDPDTGLVTSTDVIDETITRIRRKAGHAAAVAAGERLRHSTIIKVVDIDTAHREAAWELFCKRADLHLSHTDCTTAAVMDRLGLRRIFTFDSDFDDLGFLMYPRARRR